MAHGGGANGQNKRAKRAAQTQAPAGRQTLSLPFTLQHGGSASTGTAPAPVEYTNRAK